MAKQENVKIQKDMTPSPLRIFRAPRRNVPLLIVGILFTLVYLIPTVLKSLGILTGHQYVDGFLPGAAAALLAVLGINFIFFSLNSKSKHTARVLGFAAGVYMITFLLTVAALWLHVITTGYARDLEVVLGETVLMQPFIPFICMITAGIMAYLLARSNFSDKTKEYFETGSARIAIRPVSVAIQTGALVVTVALWAFIVVIPALAFQQINHAASSSVDWYQVLTFGLVEQTPLSVYLSSDIYTAAIIFGSFFALPAVFLLRSLFSKFVYTLPTTRGNTARDLGALNGFAGFVAGLGVVVLTVGVTSFYDTDATEARVWVWIGLAAIAASLVWIIIAKKLGHVPGQVNAKQSFLSPTRWR